MNTISQVKSIKKNALLSIIKQLFSIVFPMITFPYVARILGVEAYGKYTFSLSIVNYVSYIAAAGILRYAIRECAKVRENKNELQKLANEIFTINILTTLFAFATLFIFLFCIPDLHSYTPYILVISLSVLFTTIGVDWINSAYEDYFFITVRYVFSQGIAFLLLFIFVQDSNDLFYYCFISILGGVIANICNILYIRKKLTFYPKLIFSCSIIKHFKSIFYLFLSTIATFIYINSDISILRMFFDDKTVGYYGISTQFYQLIKQLIIAAFIVIIPRVSNELTKNRDVVIEKYNRTLAITLLLIIPSAVGLFMIREELISLIAGKEYLQSASSLAILAFSLIPSMLANFYINIVMIPMKMEKSVMIATIFSATINIVLNFILIPIYSENAAAATTLLAELTLTLFSIYYCRNQGIKIMSKELNISLIGSLMILLICYFLNKNILSEPLLFVSLSILFSVVVYGFLLALVYRKKLYKIINKKFIIN
ncbi:oligosaccharide flippase family protein [Actinobacillus equuli]|uniref:oligosaccharide flippase family protein n=1 Tax=Actinobacillus equuli TaxID=718 RepID=UPI002441FD49|nr:oligosaccharide flippase family protein [Actinobacillus equuli]WGE57048.1 flippase [Actinobacillus equuli subsp. equuli]